MLDLVQRLLRHWVHDPRAPLSHPPRRLQSGDQHQQRRAQIHQQGRPYRLRGKQLDKQCQHPPSPGQSTEAEGQAAQSSPLYSRLLKARQPGHLRAIDIQIDLHITPKPLIHRSNRYDITKSVKYSYTNSLI